ncbi:MAG: T9SS type B sorting domain-containing protein [Flavobacteriaceae bacterium]|nr:T9SS type B sorting domain-containing protein [Flavobacteriaceae bacterium]
MIKKNTKLLFLGVLLLANGMFAQIISINDAGNIESTQSLQQLVEEVLISGACSSVDTFSEQVSESPVDNETKSYGFFRRPAGSTFPFEEGIVLTTGRAFEAGNTTVVATGSPSNDNGMSGDTDLEIALGITNTNDATFIKFNFTPTSATISFNFLMASEEYDGTTECDFADGFAFLLREVGTPTYTNLAVLPGGTPVSVTNINNSGACAANIPFFDGYNLGATNYGGRTVVLTASSAVTPGQIYEIKLVVADQGDSVWDSAIFLEAGSFVLGADLGEPYLVADDTAVCGTSVLLDATIVASDYNWYFDDGSGFSLITGENSQTYTANLGAGIYKVEAILAAGCTAEDEIVVEFATQPTATMPTPLSMCDADNDGSIDFNLTDKEVEILNGQSPTDFEVLYYRDAAYTDQITGADITSFTSTGQTIYARVRNLSSTNCIADASFDLEVYETAFPSTTVSLLAACDNDSVGTDTDGLILFNLHDRATEILNGQSAGDFTLTYFIDAAYTIQIPVADETVFQNTIVGGQTIFVRMTNNLNTTCFTDTSFEIEVFELPVLNTPPYILEQCDDDFDGFNSFNLTEINTDIVTTITDEIFTYYETLADAEAGIAGTEIVDFTTYTNKTINTDNQIWVRIENANNCYRTMQIEIVVKPSAIPTTFLRTFSQCDDGADDTDGISIFDFSSVTAEVQAMFPTAIDVFYYRNAADATAEINEISDPSSYENTGSPNMQEIWVRADSVLGNDCLGNGHHITLIVNPIPTLNMASNLEQCDNNDDGDDTNGIGVEFDLESQSDLIRQVGMAAVDFPITYHLSAADAVSGANPQSSPYTNLTNGEQIFVRAVNVATGCINPHISFNLDVNPLPIIDFTNITLASQCDTNIDGNDTNGIGVEFDLGSLRSDFENLQPDIATTTYTVTYHALLTEAQAIPPINPLPDLYANIVNNQSIFVRIENDATGCIRIEEAVNYLVVDPLPILAPITVTPECDNNDDGDDANGVITWILDDYVPIFNTMQTSADAMTVTFHTTLTGANGVTPSDQITGTSSYQNTSNPQPIFVRVTNDVTGCYRGIEAFTLEVNPKPEFDDLDDEIVCENILPHTISVSNPDATDYTYEWFNATGTIIGTDQILSIVDATDISTTGTDYTVIVTNPTTNCTRTKTINLKKSSDATLLDEDVVTIEFNSPTNSIEIITTNLGSGDYEFALQHESDSRSWQDEPIFTDLQGGMYTILINDKNGCGEISKELFLLDYPKFLTPNNDGYNDYWQLIGLDSSTFTISPIQIFDRFGKIVAIIDPTQGQGWDGLYNNEMLPSSDYWFVLSLTNSQDETIIKKGHFSLIRR